jgi:DNA-binding CsgD family transcriptional regulator
MLTRYSEQVVLGAIGAIYDAAVAPDRWMTVLTDMRELFATASAALVVHNADRSNADGIAAGVDPEGHRTQLRTIFRTTPLYSGRLRAATAGQIYLSDEVSPPKQFFGSRMYQEYWRPRGFNQGMTLVVSIDQAGIRHVINLLRADRFDATEIALARVLMPHLQRAVAVQRHMSQTDLLAAAALDALDTLQQAVLLLADDGGVLHANASAEALLRAADGFAARDGLLGAATPALTERLHTVIACAAGKCGAPARAGWLRLPRSDGGTALSLLAAPIRQDAHWSLRKRPAVVVCVADPDSRGAIPGRTMMDLFGLTGAEAALANDLLAGKPLRDIALERRRSLNTVRTQLASLMGKTGVNRQSDLVRLLGTLPPIKQP